MKTFMGTDDTVGVLNDLNSGVRPWQNISVGQSANNTSCLFSAGSVGCAIKTVTAAYALNFYDHTVLADTTSAAFALTLPTSVGIAGRQYRIINIGTHLLTINTTSSQTINGGTSLSVPSKYFSVFLISDGANWYAV